MNCEICALDASVDPALWTCAGCPRKFHAACIGLTVQRGSLRRKDKKTIDVGAYILPCCDSCQELMQARLNFDRLTEQQKLLTNQLHEHTQVIHRFAMQQEKPNTIDEVLEGVEILMTTIKNELVAINKSNSLTGSVNSIKNHITAALDLVTMKTLDTISNSTKAVTSDIATGLRKIDDEVCKINQLYIDLASTTAMTSNPNIGIDILDELKSWSANLLPKHNTTTGSQADSFPSLEEEMNAAKVDAAVQTSVDASGWRILGSRKVWKADWTEYDARQFRRSTQHKLEEKARKRRKQRRRTSSTYQSQTNIKQSHNHDKMHQHFINSQRGPNFLAPDRELLAAAKVHFSRPPNNYKPTMRFEKGETLNPYPSGSANVHQMEKNSCASRVPVQQNGILDGHPTNPTMVTPNRTNMKDINICTDQCFCRQRRTP